METQVSFTQTNGAPSLRVHLALDPTALRITHTTLGLRLQLEDWLPAGPVGGPGLPARTIWVALPPGLRPVELSVQDVEYTPVTREPAVLAPLSPPRRDVPDNTTSALATVARAAEHYARLRQSPPPLAGLAGTQRLGDTDLALIEIHPVSLTVEGCLQLAVQLQLELKLAGQPTRADGVAEAAAAPLTRSASPSVQAVRLARLASLSVVNPQAVAAPAARVSVLKDRTETWDYVVITDNSTWNSATKQPLAPITPGLVDAFTPLVTWKNQIGLRARVVTVAEIVQSRPNHGLGVDFTVAAADLQAVIRNFLAWAHVRWHTAYVLLGGDQNVVPIRHIQNGSAWDKSLPTDFYYADLDSTCNWFENQAVDLFAVTYRCDLSVGRAPVTNRVEADNFVAKVIAYEQLGCNGVAAPDWLRKVLFASSKWGGDSPTNIDRSAGFPPGDNRYYHAPGSQCALIKLIERVVIARDQNHPTGNPDPNCFNRPNNTFYKIQLVPTYKTVNTISYVPLGATAGVAIPHTDQAGPGAPGWFYTDWLDNNRPCHNQQGENYPTTWIIVYLPTGGQLPGTFQLQLNGAFRLPYNLLSKASAGNYNPLPYSLAAGAANVLAGNPVAQGQWNTIRSGHELVPMQDGRVLDWAPADGAWRLWNYDPASYADVLPGSPVAQGQWNTIRTGHTLVLMHDGRVLDWVSSSGAWRLWNYDPGSYADVLPGSPVAQGRWNTIRTGHTLVPMHDGRVLDWVPSNGTWRLWNYDPASYADVLPGGPVAQGQWPPEPAGRRLIRMHDGRVLQWVVPSGAWWLSNYDPVGRNEGWYYARSATDPRPSSMSLVLGAQLATPWLAVYAAGSALDPVCFVLDPCEEADTMVEEERLRKIMQLDFPEWNDVSRLYPDVVDLPPADRYAPAVQYYTRERLRAELNEGQHVVSVAGHGNPSCTCAYGEGGDFNLDVADSLTNGTRCGILFANSCLTNRYTEDSLSRHLVVKNNQGGLVAYVGCMDEISIGLGSSVQRKFFHDLAMLMQGPGVPGAGAAHLGLAFDARVGMLQAGAGFDITSADVRYTIIMMSLLGDPALSVHTTVAGEG